MHVTIPIVSASANANPSVCGPCGGKCCKTMPGIVFPNELDAQLRREVIADKVLAMLESGRYSLDWWEGNPHTDDWRGGRSYFLRPAIQGSEGQWAHDAWGGTCTFHGVRGCELDERRRPLECRALIPDVNGHCFKPAGWEVGGRRLASQAWSPFNETLAMFVDLYQETEETRNSYADHL